MEFTIGSDVWCSDGVCGELKRVVVDPVARTLTHLVVELKYRSGTGHLVPVDLVEATTAEIQLRCTISEFEKLEEAQETQFLPGASGQWSYRQDQMLSWPYYGLSAGDPEAGDGTGGDAKLPTTTFDRVPIGEVEVRRGEQVHATDGAIGRVRGLVIDPGSQQVTHVLLDEGHLWGHKRVAIPISAVVSIQNGLRLRLSKDDVRELPPVDLDHEG